MTNPNEYPTPHTANPGDTLRNGAILVAKFFDVSGRCYVAAEWRPGKEWASWLLDNKGHCHWGEYFWGDTPAKCKLDAIQSASNRSK
jgi:hypothetical protein